MKGYLLAIYAVLLMTLGWQSHNPWQPGPGLPVLLMQPEKASLATNRELSTPRLPAATLAFNQMTQDNLFVGRP